MKIITLSMEMFLNVNLNLNVLNVYKNLHSPFSCICFLAMHKSNRDFFNCYRKMPMHEATMNCNSTPSWASTLIIIEAIPHSLFHLILLLLSAIQSQRFSNINMNRWEVLWMIPIRSTKTRVEQDLTFYCCTLVKLRAD